MSDPRFQAADDPEQERGKVNERGKQQQLPDPRGPLATELMVIRHRNGDSVAPPKNSTHYLLKRLHIQRASVPPCDSIHALQTTAGIQVVSYTSIHPMSSRSHDRPGSRF